VLLADRLDGRTRLATTFKKKGFFFFADPPDERDLAAWLETEARRRNTSFEHGAATSLALTIGADLTALSDALDRLHLYAGQRPIRTSDVDEIVAPLREATHFELPEAIGQRDLPRALALAHQLIRQREAGLLVLTFIARQVRLIARARDAIERGDDVASALKLPPFIVRGITAQARRWTPAQLNRALRVCAQADARFKTGGGRDRDARLLEETVLALTGGPGMGEPALGG
jgi:DNA polymerase-3 subunit delta